MVKCDQCGGRMRRVHRTFFERFTYMAIYACRNCDREQAYLRRYAYHLGPHCRCPHCGTFRITRLKARDKIDPMQSGLLNYLERLAGGKLHHCRFCRVQFYDRRMMASEDKTAEPAPHGPEVAPSRDGGHSDA